MKTLDLVLKGKPYDLIESGEKKAEYREIKPYWCKRITGLAPVCPYSLPSSVERKRICQKTGSPCVSGYDIKYDKIRFRRGYTKRSMTYEITTMQAGYGKEEWLAPKDEMVFILNIGNRVEENTEKK